jgi:hypothetical protein
MRQYLITGTTRPLVTGLRDGVRVTRHSYLASIPLGWVGRRNGTRHLSHPGNGSHGWCIPNRGL